MTFTGVWSISARAMINGWRTKMHGDIPRHNGGPRREEVDKLLPIGKRITIEVHGLTSQEADAFLKGMADGLMPEIWLSEDGKFA